MKPRTQAIVRVIVLAIGGLATALGLYCLIVSCALFLDLQRWSKARLLDIEVDVSQPGEFSGRFTPDCPFAFCYQLVLVLPPSLSDRLGSVDSLSGMEARISVTDSHGSDLPKVKERPVQVALMMPSKTISLGGIPHPLSKETYTLKLTVSKGAEALSGTKQRLFLEYRIGFQAIVWLVGLVVAVSSLSVGVISLRAGHRLRKV